MTPHNSIPWPPTGAHSLRRDICRRLGLAAGAAEGDSFVLLGVRLTEIKKPLLAIEAIAALLGGARPNARLIVAGTGEMLDEVSARAAELGIAERVHFLGDRPRAEIAQLMQASDALLLTARSEGGGPRVVVEALACGLPVVSTMVVEVRRTVTTGRNGWLVDDPSPQALADGLEWVLSQPRESLAREAVAAAAPFTAERILGGLYETYRDLYRSSRSGGSS